MMEFRLTDRDYTRAIQILAVLYVKYTHEMYIDYMAATRACSEWLIPDYETRMGTRSGYRIQGGRFNSVSYEVQQLSSHWKLDSAGVIAALNWAQEEVDKHATSNPQTSFSFEYSAPPRVPPKISTAKVTRSAGRGL